MKRVMLMVIVCLFFFSGYSQGTSQTQDSLKIEQRETEPPRPCVDRLPEIYDCTEYQRSALSTTQTDYCNTYATLCISSDYENYQDYDITWYLNGVVYGHGPRINVFQQGSYTVQAYTNCGWVDGDNDFYVEFPEITGSGTNSPIDIGTLRPSSPFDQTLYNSHCFGNNMGQPSNDIYYKFDLENEFEVNVSTCESSIDTYVYLLNSYGNIITSNNNNGPLCTGQYASLKALLPAGTYFVVSEGYGSAMGNIKTSINITPGSPPPPPVIVADSTDICYGSVTHIRTTDGQPALWYAYDTEYLNGAVYDSKYTEPIKARRKNSYGYSEFSNVVYITANYRPSPPVVSANQSSFCNGGGTTLHAAGNNIKWYRNGTFIGSGNDIWIDQAGDYTATTENRCYTSYASENLAIAIISPPPVPHISTLNNNTVFCPTTGSPLTLVSDTDVKWYRIYPGKQYLQYGKSAYPDRPGIYCAYNVGPCDSTQSNQIEITNGVPGIVSNFSTETIQPGCGQSTGSIKFMADPPPDGTVYYELESIGGWDTKTQYSGLAPGKYELNMKVVGSNGCDSYIQNTNFIILPPPANPAIPQITASGPVSFCKGASVILSAPAGYSSYSWNNGLSTRQITVTSADNYRVTVTNAAGCSSTSEPVAVNVHPLAPPVILANGPLTFCSDGSVTLTAPTSSQYQWNTGSISQSIVVNSSGKYAVSVKNASGCWATSDSITVTKLLIAINGQQTICEGEQTTLSASPGFSSYRWFKNGVEIAGSSATTSQLQTGEAGFYTVEGITSTGNCRSLAFQLNVSPLPTILPVLPNAVATSASSYNSCGPVQVSLRTGTGRSLTDRLSYQVFYDDQTEATITTPAFILEKSGRVEAVYAGENGCSKSLSFNVAILSAAALPKITASGPTSFCQGESVILSAPEGYTYLWSSGEISRSITVTNPGEYTVKVSNGSGCSSTSGIVRVMVNPRSSTPVIQ